MISEHFSRIEFACKCGCGFQTVDVELLNVLERLRERFSQPIVINSGCRCPKHNKAIRGSENSKHIQGSAADIVVKNTPTEEVYIYLAESYPDKYGIGKYASWIHIDVRTDRARW